MFQLKGKKERFSDNPWKVISLALLIVVVCFIVMDRYDIQFVDKEGVDGGFDEVEVCGEIVSTPTWTDDSGRILATGYRSFGNQSWDVVNRALIPNKVHFVYNSKCGWCHQQIEYFGLTWQDYVDAGLTHDCGEILNK